MASISPHEEKMLNLQHQMRQNQSELQNYLAGLDDWTSEIKEKEKQLKSQQKETKNADLPPVRNTIEKKKLKKKRKKEKAPDPNKPKKIGGFDFRAWDKFDVDKALADIDGEEKKAETSSSEYETDEEWEMERKKHLGELEKDKGNKFLKAGDLERAVEAYSKGMEFDPTNSLLPANRALALIKQQKFAAAELDCTTCITLDPLYVKAYLRRATARAGLGKIEDAMTDYRCVLDLEPSNKQAKTELERMEKELIREKEGPVKSSYVEGQTGIVKPVYKSLEERSKVPLRRIVIEEIGIELPSQPQRKVEQSEVAQKITAKEEQAFDALFASATPAGSSITTTTTTTTTEAVHQVVSSDQGDRLTQQPERSLTKKLEVTSSLNDKAPGSPVSNDTTVSRPAHDTKLLSGSNSASTHSNADNLASEVKHKNAASSDSPRQAGGDGLDLQIPQSSFQFQADFKLLKKKPEAFTHYFQAIPPSQYPKLFGQCFDADILNTIINCLSQYTVKNMFEILHHLTLVKRFSMTAMFLSKMDKKVIEGLLQQISASGDHTEDEIINLRQMYQL